MDNPLTETVSDGYRYTLSNGKRITVWPCNDNGSQQQFVSGQEYRYRLARYHITYNYNGGTGSPPEQTFLYGENLRINATGSKQVNIYFDYNDGTGSTYTVSNSCSIKNWTDTTHGGQTFTNGSIYNRADDATFVAEWNECYVTFPTVTRTGYTLNRWISTSDGQTVTSNTGFTQNTNVRAIWTPNRYRVNFDANGGTVKTTTNYVTYDSYYGTLPTPTRTGYVFLGWYTLATGGTEITSSTRVEITDNQTLYAHWKGIDAISIDSTNTKKYYYVGEDIDLSETLLLVRYSDGTEEEAETGFTCFPTRFNVLGKQTVTVTYEGKKCTFDVYVREDKDEAPPYWGDVNGDRKIDDADARLVLSYFAGNIAFNEEQRCFSDINFDGLINQKDSKLITKYSNGDISFDDIKENTSLIFTDFTKTTYIKGESLDKTGLSVIITNSTNPNIRYEFTDEITVTGYHKNVIGPQTLTVSFRDYKTTKTVNVVDNSPSQSSIEDIEMTDYKELYYRGESLDFSSLILTVNYADGTSKRYSDGFTCSPTGFYTPGNQTVTVDYKGKTCTFDVYVKESRNEASPYWGDVNGDHIVNEDDCEYILDYLKDIENLSEEQLCFADVNLDGIVDIADYTLLLKYIKGLQNLQTENAVISFSGFEKFNYIEGEPIDTSDLSVVLTNSTDSDVRYELTHGVTVSGYDPNTVGTQVLTFTYRGYTTTKTVNVYDDVSSIEVDLENTKTVYYVGDTFYPTDATLIITFADGTTESINSGFDITEPNLNKVGHKRVKITYDSKTVSYNIDIVHAPLSNVTIATLPDKIEYEPGDELDSSGLFLHIEYENGYSQDIEEGFDISYDFRTSGRKQVTITYTEDNITKTASFYATVLQSTRIYAENTSAQAGSTVSVPIMIDNNKGIMAFRITVDYDQNAMTPVSVTAENDLTGLFDNSIDTSEPGSFDIVWSGSENITRGGTIVTVTFNIKNNVLGQYSVGLSYNPEDTFNEDGDDVKLECEDFSISVYGSGGDVSTIIMSNFSVRCGETVDVPVNIFNNKGIEQTTVTIEYDKDLLIPKGINNGIANVVGENLLSADGTLEIQIGELLSSAGDGALFTIGFEVKYVEPQETFLAISSTDGTICIGPEVSILNGTAKIYSDDVSVDGSSVTVPVKINGNPGIMGFRLSFSYDDNIIAPVSVSRGAVLSSGSIENTIATSSVSSFDVIWNGNDDVTDNGVLFNITFNLLNTSAESFEINIEYNSDDTFNSEWKEVEFNCEDIIWNKIQEVTVTYDANGGTVEPENTTLIKGESLILPLPEKEEYTFSGWYSDSQLTSFVGEAGDSFIPTDDITLFAKWADTTIPTGTISSTNNLDSKQTVTLKLNDNIGVAGYYWGTKSNYLQNTYITVDGAPKSKTIQFELNTPGKYYFVVKDTSGNVSSAVNKTFYKVTLNSNGGTVSPDTVFMMAGKTIALPEPTRTDYTFVEWNTEENGNGTSINAESYKPTATTTIYAQWEEIVLTKIAVKTKPNKLIYFVGDNLDQTGLTLTATYSDGSTKTISNSINCTPQVLITAGSQKITVEYGGKSTSFNVTVKVDTVTGIEISTLPTKQSYYVGDTLDSTGLTLTATYVSGKTETVTEGFTCSPTSLNTAGNQEIEVTYAEQATSFNVTVFEDTISKIAVKTKPTKVIYNVGETLDTTGLTLTATYISGKTERVTSGFTCTPTLLNTVGTQKITVKYAGKSTSFNVTVKEDVITAIAVTTEPAKVNYYVGESLDSAGLTLTATYESGKKETVTEGFTCSPTSLNTAGNQEIEVTYAEQSTSFNVTVVEDTISKIAIKTKPTKLVYYKGDTLDTTGLTLTATYASGKTETVTSNFNCTPTALNTVGTQKIIIKYSGKSTSFNVTVNEPESILKIMPKEGTSLIIERCDVNDNSIIETKRQEIINGTEELPYGVSQAISANDSDYSQYPKYSEDASEYDSWFIYGIEQYTTPEALKELIEVGEGSCVISNVQGEFVGTGSIVKIFDKNGNFVEQFRVVLYGDLDNSGSITSSDTNIAIQESKNPSWSKASGERVPYMFRAANVDQSPSFSSSDANFLIMCNKNKAYIDQVTGRAYIKPGYTATWEAAPAGSDLDTLLVCTPITYYATFVADGNQVGNKVPFTVEDETISEPDVPAKEGYENGRWESYSIEANDITVNALYDEQCKHTDSDNDGKCDECGEAMVYTKDVIVDGEKVGEVTFTYGDTTIDNLPDVPEKTGYTGKWEYTITGSELDIHPKYTPITYYATFMADGKQVGDKIAFTVEMTSISEPSVPAKDGYTGKWSAYSLTASNITINAVYEKIPAPSNPTADAKLNVKSSATVDYRSIVTITATATGVPEGYVLAIFDGNTELARGDNKSVSYKVGEMKSGRTFTVKVIDANGNVQKDSSGAELSKTCEVKVNSGFFAKLIAFFRGLFRLLPNIDIKP